MDKITYQNIGLLCCTGVRKHSFKIKKVGRPKYEISHSELHIINIKM
jgi:hypothetical protein